MEGVTVGSKVGFEVGAAVGIDVGFLVGQRILFMIMVFSPKSRTVPISCKVCLSIN